MLPGDSAVVWVGLLDAHDREASWPGYRRAPTRLDGDGEHWINGDELLWTVGGEEPFVFGPAGIYFNPSHPTPFTRATGAEGSVRVWPGDKLVVAAGCLRIAFPTPVEVT